MCGHRRKASLNQAGAVGPGPKTVPPGRAGADHLRASDSEREAVLERLREHATVGRLNMEELGRRSEAALEAVTLADLRALSADLPEAPAGRPSRRAAGGHELRVYLATSLLLVAIWLATGLGYFWPLWPILGWGICVLGGLGAIDPVRSRAGGRRRPARAL